MIQNIFAVQTSSILTQGSSEENNSALHFDVVGYASLRIRNSERPITPNPRDIIDLQILRAPINRGAIFANRLRHDGRQTKENIIAHRN